MAPKRHIAFVAQASQTREATGRRGRGRAASAPAVVSAHTPGALPTPYYTPLSPWSLDCTAYPYPHCWGGATPLALPPYAAAAASVASQQAYSREHAAALREALQRCVDAGDGSRLRRLYGTLHDDFGPWKSRGSSNDADDEEDTDTDTDTDTDADSSAYRSTVSRVVGLDCVDLHQCWRQDAWARWVQAQAEAVDVADLAEAAEAPETKPAPAPHRRGAAKLGPDRLRPPLLLGMRAAPE